LGEVGNTGRTIWSAHEGLSELFSNTLATNFDYGRAFSVTRENYAKPMEAIERAFPELEQLGSDASRYNFIQRVM
jgi:hypothetical protein